MALIDAGVFIRPRFYTPEKNPFHQVIRHGNLIFFEKLLTTYNAICIAENLERPGLQTAMELAVECGRWDMVIAIARKYKKSVVGKVPIGGNYKREYAPGQIYELVHIDAQNKYVNHALRVAVIANHAETRCSSFLLCTQ
ncbi:MAG: hypothetical protein NTU49_07830 [Gammaproteobacteria bacterium]|nr:hypothetical protein [Gammaproteobacteria bacterium]